MRVTSSDLAVSLPEARLSALPAASSGIRPWKGGIPRDLPFTSEGVQRVGCPWSSVCPPCGDRHASHWVPLTKTPSVRWCVPASRLVPGRRVFRVATCRPRLVVTVVPGAFLELSSLPSLGTSLFLAFAPVLQVPSHLVSCPVSSFIQTLSGSLVSLNGVFCHSVT